MFALLNKGLFSSDSESNARHASSWWLSEYKKTHLKFDKVLKTMVPKMRTYMYLDGRGTPMNIFSTSL